MKYPRLFSPIRLAGLEIPNRVAMSAMSTHMAAPGGFVTPEQVAYYRERALGGVGLIAVEYSCVDRATGLAETTQLCFDELHHVPGHVRIVEAIRETGARAFLQLHHAGRNTSPAVLGAQTVAPSAVPYRTATGPVIPRELQPAEVERLIACFERSAHWAVEAGYEGIELHGAHGYLLGQFLSPHTNRRDDEWGGDYERRLRFPVEVIKAVKRALGPNRPLVWRMSAIEFVDGGLTIEDTEAIAPRLAQAGADAISVSMGTFDSLDYVVEPMSAEEGWRLPYCGRIRRAAGVPVLAAGMIRTPTMAEQALADGEGDIITLGRPLLADPDWPNKARAGRDEDIRPCTTCNWCVGRGGRHLGTACAENPRAGHEADPRVPAFGQGRTAAVVGAGPGGIVAALLLDQAGFKVKLFEARPKVGGGLIVSATPPHKDKLYRYLEYLQRRLAASGVEVLLNQRVNAATLAEVQPALVIVAAGAPPVRMPIEGADAPHVGLAYDLLIGDSEVRPGDLPSRKVAVYGGGETGCETAEFLAQHGVPVTLVTRSPATQLARSAERMYRKHLLERLQGNTLISVRENATITRISQGEAHIGGADDPVVLADHVFIAQGQVPDSGFAATLALPGVPQVVIGDSVRVRRIGDAVQDAYRAVMTLSERLAPARLAC